MHYPGETMHFTFGKDKDFTHSVQNIGDTDLLFTTVEYRNGANEPQPIPDCVRLKAPM